MHASQHGACWGQDGKLPWLEDRFVTLAEALRERGYQTMAVSNNDHVSQATNLTQGFDAFAAPVAFADQLRSLQFPFYELFLRRIRVLGPVRGPWLVKNQGGRATAQFAARMLSRRRHSRPFFLFVNYMETHFPAEPLKACVQEEALRGPRGAVSEYLHWPERHLLEAQLRNPKFDPSPWQVSYRAIFNESWKLVRSSRARLELYNLDNDPAETRDISQSNHSKSAELAQQMETWLGSFNHFDANRSSAPRDTRLDEQQRRRLRDLGYVQ